MIEVLNDAGSAGLSPSDNIDDLATMVGLVVGRDVKVTDLSPQAQTAINEFLETLGNDQDLALSLEEFNELLLLFNQQRLERPFFDFFFLGHFRGESPTQTAVRFEDLKDGVKRFRAFAMLRYGNYRSAYQVLSRVGNSVDLLGALDPWNRDSNVEEDKFKTRRPPLLPLSGSQDEIPGDKTWLLGYLSSSMIDGDGVALAQLTDLTAAGQRVGESSQQLEQAAEDLRVLGEDRKVMRSRGLRNTVKYLTWDFIDVYVATSMRQVWEYEETSDLIKSVFVEELKDFPNVRWFDPTQSYSVSTIDKGLIEGLMLKRAECTIYMAQDSETLGKDSELAATLAQGKPVIAYVRSIQPEEIENFAAQLKRRPVRFFRHRLLTLQAEGFFDRPDNREKVSLLARKVGLSIPPDQIRAEVMRLVGVFSKFDSSRRFQLIGEEENEFVKANSDESDGAAKLLAAVESRAADSRAETIKSRHPLGFQVHLETGVANGVLVARTPKECARLVREILLKSLQFDIELQFPDPPNGDEVATLLVEHQTKSRFRVVTNDECLTNSFWNFYLPTGSTAN